MKKTFNHLGLSPEVLAAVDSMGFTTPTPIQDQTIPIVLAERDVVGAAQTGTGKTAAFVLPIMDMLQRELAADRARFDEEQARRQAEREAVEAEQAATAPEAADVAAEAVAAEPEAVATAEAAAAAEAEPEADPEHAPAKKKRRKRKKKHQHKRPKGPFALVITPTRELAQQIDDVASVVGGFTDQRVMTVVGGKKYGPQVEGIAKGIDMLVATPGRLIDLMEQRAVDLSKVRFLVLDEADRMLDMGFWPSVRKIVAAVPKERQTLLFSATLSKDILNQVHNLLREPEFVEVARKGETADTVQQFVMPVSQMQKSDLLQQLLEQKGGTRILIFTRTKRRADACARRLKKAGLHADSIHSDKTQSQRQRILDDFKAGKLDILVATDVLSRGIDVTEIDYVVNYDVPLDPEDYVHRIGRTGRAGLGGEAYTFVAVDEITAFREIEYFTKKIIDVYDLEGFEYTDDRIVPRADRSAERGKSATGKRRMAFSGSRRRGSYPRRR